MKESSKLRSLIEDNGINSAVEAIFRGKGLARSIWDHAHSSVFVITTYKAGCGVELSSNIVRCFFEKVEGIILGSCSKDDIDRWVGIGDSEAKQLVVSFWEAINDSNKQDTWTRAINNKGDKEIVLNVLLGMVSLFAISIAAFSGSLEERIRAADPASISRLDHIIPNEVKRKVFGSHLPNSGLYAALVNQLMAVFLDNEQNFGTLIGKLAGYNHQETIRKVKAAEDQSIQSHLDVWERQLLGGTGLSISTILQSLEPEVSKAFPKKNVAVNLGEANPRTPLQKQSSNTSMESGASRNSGDSGASHISLSSSTPPPSSSRSSSDASVSAKTGGNVEKQHGPWCRFMHALGLKPSPTPSGAVVGDLPVGGRNTTDISHAA